MGSVTIGGTTYKLNGTRDSGTRQDTFTLVVQVEGNSLGIWDKKTGGDLDSDEVKYYPGGMGDALSLGGRLVPNNVTLQRLYDLQDDHDNINYLLQAVGHGAVKVTQRPLQLNGQGYGKLVTWNGILKRVLIPDVDSEATSAALIEIEVSVSSPPAAA
jgi:hypothetical protein